MKTISALQIARLRQQRQLLGNPFRGLTPQLLSAQLDEFAAGHLRSASQTWDMMERRNPMLGSVARKRYKSVSRLDWQVLKSDDSPEAELHAKVLEEFWDRVQVTDAMDRNRKGGLSLLLAQAARCIGHRWSVHEIVWKPEPGRLGATFTLVPLWFFENTTGELRFLPGDYSQAGLDLEPGGWLVHCGDGLMEATSMLVSQIGLGLGDWLSYSEKFGMPGLLGKSGAQPGSAEWDQFCEALAEFGQDWAAVMPQGSDVQLVEAGGAAGLPQKELVEYFERRVVTLWRGADLGTMSQGAGGVGASLQGDETDILIEDDVPNLVEPLRAQVERYVIEWYFGAGVEPKAYLTLPLPERDTTDQDLRIDETLTRLGVPLATADTAERYGRQMAKAGEATLAAPQPAAPSPGAPAGPFPRFGLANESSVDEFAAAMAEDLKPVRERLIAIQRMDDPSAQRGALLSLRLELRDYLRRARGGSTAARAMERILGAAMVGGLLTTPEDPPK